MKLHSLAFVDAPTQAWLSRCLDDIAVVTVTSAEELHHEIDQDSQFRLVFIQMDAGRHESALELMRKLASRRPDLAVVAVAEQADSSMVLEAMRAGARDFLIQGQDDSRIQELVKEVLNRGTARTQQGSHVVAILAGHADPGMAFLAEHLALAMTEKQRQNEAVLLLDLASPAGAASVFMNIQHDYSALDAIADAYRCDATLVDTAFARHRNGPYVLSMPETLVGAPQVEADELGRFLDVVASLFSRVIVCADQGLHTESMQCVSESAQHKLILSDQSILFSRHNQQLLRNLRAAGMNLENTGLVVDRYQRRVGLEPEKLAELLQLPLYAVMAGDPGNRLKAMNAGDSLFDTAPSDEYLRGVRLLAQQLLGRVQGGAPKRGFLEKLLS